ncbi:EamA family transporter [Candidatus Pacearchaeota archaeon]|nr:EamA family transporter [Candidatus Pacearchaeota archaeon]
MADTSTLAIILVIISTFIGALGNFFLKKFTHKKICFKNPFLYFGIIFLGITALIYLIALSMGSLNVLYPLNSFVYIWINLISWKYLKEDLNIYKWAGILFIILGSLVVVN